MDVPNTEPWMLALDRLACEIGDAMKVAERADTAQVPVGEWVDALLELASLRASADDADGESEVLDVLCLLLRASANGHWGGGKPCQQDWVSVSMINKLCAVLQYALNSMDVNEASLLVSDALASLVLSAIDNSEVAVVLEALQGHASFVSASLKLLRNSPSPEGDQWSSVFTRFVLRLVSSSSSCHDYCGKELPMLSMLSGSEGNVRAWITHTWETKWSLRPADSISRQLLGGSKECITLVRRILDGFSIPQTEPPRGSSSMLASAISFLRHAHRQRGLLHGVDITFVKDGHLHDYWNNQSRKSTRVRWEDVSTALRSGYTIGIRGMQARSIDVFHLCNSLQRELGQHVNANLYWTPPDGQGFGIHVDDHCVFVIQLKGKKRWYLYDRLDELPTLFEDTRPHFKSQQPPLDAEILLEEGSVLYIPRGVAHHADTRDLSEESIHITIGVEIDKSHTDHRLLDDFPLAKTTTIPSRADGRGGLMAWHLQDTQEFVSHYTSTTGLCVGAAMVRELELLRYQIWDERGRYLESRAMAARAMATLHDEMTASSLIRFDEDTQLVPSKDANFTESPQERTKKKPRYEER